MSHVPPPPPGSGEPTPRKPGEHGEHPTPEAPGQPAWGGQPTPQDPQQTQQWGQQPGQQGQPPQPGQQSHPQQPGQWAPPGEPQAPWAQQPTQGYGQPGAATGQHQGQQWGQPAQPQQGHPGQPYQQPQQWQQPGQQGQHPQQWQQQGQQQGQQWQQPGQQGQQWGPPAPAKKGSRGLLVGILAAVVVVALGVTAFFVFFAGSDPEALEPDVSLSTQATVGQLVVGNCLEDISGSVGDVSVVPCADDHTSQVIGSTTFTDGDFPGQPTLVAQTTAACTPDLVTSGDVPADELALVVWTPSEASWSGGDRVGLCIATVDGSTTGSLVG
jgi:hypothetical protein